MIAALLLACATHAPPKSASDLVYFVMVDRFANGDARNDGAIDPADPAAFHGGDLAGVRAHLDQLQALGVRTIWLSPLFEMRTDKIDGHGAFHGYWTTDLGALEPRFGEPRDLRRLVDEAHERDMRVVLDLVLNHVGYDAPLTQTRPEWFHDLGDVADWSDPLERVNHDVHGLPDLALEREDTYRYQLNHALRWIDETGADGYRIDAVRHMPTTVQARLAEDLRAQHPDLWLLGEVFEGDPAALAEARAGTGYSAVFDFPLHYAMIDTFCRGRPPGRLASTLSLDRLYGELLRQRPEALVTFLDNHDVPRLRSECGGDVGKATVALAFLMAMRGTPSLSWGTEAALTGAGEPENRTSMPWGSPMPLAGAIQTLVALREDHPSLRSGLTTVFSLTDTSLTLMRLSENERAFVTLNLGAEPMPVVGSEGAMVPAYAIVVDRAGHIGPGSTVPAGGLGIAFWRRASLPGGCVDVPFYAGTMSTAWAPPLRRVELRAQAPLAPGESLLWVGAGPELGNWDPTRAIAVSNEGLAAIDVPIGTVLASKLVRRDAEGQLRWESGEDRYLLVTAGEGPQTFDATLRLP